MAVQLVVAPAGHGKTAYAIDALRSLPPLSPARVLVPSQIASTAFRRRMAQAGGVLGVRVQTFYGLYADVLALARGALGVPQPERGMANLVPFVRQRLIQHVAKDLFSAKRLSHYAPAHGSAGFTRLLGHLFGELKRARVFPDALVRALAGREARLVELAHLYAAYQDWLLDTGWIDADGQGWLAANALEGDPSLLADLALLVVDGFDEFNPTQLDLMRLLADRAAMTLVTLTGDPQHPSRLAHRRLIRARGDLERALAVEVISLSRPRPDGRLAHLEAVLFNTGRSQGGLSQGALKQGLPEQGPLEQGPLEQGPHATASLDADSAVAFVEAQNRALEAREALRWLKARLVRDRLSPSDVAIIARDTAPYWPLLEEAAAEFGLPLHFVSGIPLHTNPAIMALLDVLSIPLGPDPWSPRAVLDLLTNPYLDWTGCSLEAGDGVLLYEVASTGQVISGLDQWREGFQHVADRREAPEALLDRDDGEEALASHRFVGRSLAARLESVFEALIAWITPPSQATLRERVVWLEALIGGDPERAGADRGDAGSLNMVACARANPMTVERDIAALGAFKDILRGLVLAEALFESGDKVSPSPDQFVGDLVEAVQDAIFTIPEAGESIVVASALEARGLEFDSVALLGLSEGDFPAAERQDPLLREGDRALLAEHHVAIEPRLRGDEVTFFYHAVTRARRRLLICRPYLADDGQPWEASPYWMAVRQVFEDVTVRQVRPTDRVSDAASAQELIDLLSGSEVQDMVAVLRARTRGDTSPWNGDLAALKDALAERFGADQLWSSSRLESYARCPLHFWAVYAMELEPRDLPQLGFDVLILGSIYHLVLERLYDRVPDGDPDRLRSELPAIAQQVYDAAPNHYGFRPTPLWQRQQRELSEALSRTLDALIDQADGYVPLDRELAFGVGKHPALSLEGEPPLRLRGYIDRVDRGPDGRLRIIDYKAGSTLVSARDLSDGHRLQLPLYALAAQEALQSPVTSGFYWHIGAAKPSTLKLETYASPDGKKRGVAGAVETAVNHAVRIAASVRAGQFAPEPPDAGCPGFCPAAAFCERYRPRGW